MGSSNSPAQFDITMSAVTLALVFHRPDLFASDPALDSSISNLRLLFSYLDDFMCAARDLTHAAQQYAFFSVIGGWLGLVFLPSKFEPPSQEQTLLGLIYNSIHKVVALKQKIPLKVFMLLEDLKAACTWSVKEIQVVLGNLIWVSFALPKLRAFTTPFILLMCHANSSSSGRVVRAAFPELSKAADDSLELIMLILAVDPSISVFMFLGVMTTLQSFPCSDASGWEICPKNVSSGTLGGFFLHPDVQKSIAFSLPWATVLQFFPPDFQEKHAMLHINYLEFASAWILLVWLVLAFPKLVRHRRIILKLDSQVAIAWIFNGRCSTFPFYRLMQFVAFLE